MSSKVSIYVAISISDGVYKHWGVFIDAPKEEDKVLLQVTGSDGRFRYELEATDVRKSERLVELLPLYDVDLAKINSIKTIASQVTVRNEIRGWNCQDYVLDLMEALEKAAIVNNTDTSYKKQKNLLHGKQEGLA
ncbi:hypothetical protein N7491_005153 [Penicillium cf. griseofulvum]|uniref:Uncharacterized protein n=1 Tax=Penicillium cf. griseofulvum TaxID=2972120 RepID=A0A9W9J370_9EURO|nr:hypothetical protein N7472_007846 [Penicillium cf. griseofulvum]KAJ5434558.1 hypothetical protein N7491_005153 [Penicillium cf. griseofulvum]KAJ5452387.1 hypothetical protein N7445_000570 [Penicillium cf. griseofulvum]